MAELPGVFVGFLGNIRCSTGDQELCLIHVDMPLTFHARLHRLNLGDTLFMGVHDEHLVISADKFLHHTRVKPTGNASGWRHQLPCQTLHCTERWPIHHSGHWLTCPGWHTAQSSTPGPPIPTTGPSLANDRRLSQDRRSRFVNGDVFLLQLAKNEDGISATPARHKAEPHIIDAHYVGEGEI